MPTDTSERGLERLVCTTLTGHACDPLKPGEARERPAAYGVGWIGGYPEDYDREYCVDVVQLTAFLEETQPDVVEPLGLREDGPVRRKFLARLQGKITKRGTIDVLRKGLKHGSIDSPRCESSYEDDHTCVRICVRTDEARSAEIHPSW